MSVKSIVWIVVLAVAVLGAGYFFLGRSPSPAANLTAPAPQISGSTTQVAQTGNPVGLSSGISDADLNADLGQLDAQTSSASTTSASVDQGMNDKPIPQTE